MQEIIDVRDDLRLRIEDIEGGYTAIGRILKISKVSVFNALKESNKPKVETLRKIKGAVEAAELQQQAAIRRLKG